MLEASCKKVAVQGCGEYSATRWAFLQWAETRSNLVHWWESGFQRRSRGSTGSWQELWLKLTRMHRRLIFATASHAIPAFKDLSTNQAIICANCKSVLFPNQKRLKFKPVGDLTLNQTTTSSNKEPRPSPHNFLTRSECRGSSRRVGGQCPPYTISRVSASQNCTLSSAIKFN